MIAAQNKSGSKSPMAELDLETTCKMVPHAIMDGVLTELVSYENNPKGKKMKTERGSHRAKPYNMSSRRGGAGGSFRNSSPNSGLTTPPLLSPQGSDLSSSSADLYQSPEGYQSPPTSSPLTAPVTSVANVTRNIAGVTTPPLPAPLPQDLLPAASSGVSSNVPNGGPNGVPSSLELDMVAPPNAVAPLSMAARKPQVSASPAKQDEEDEGEDGEKTNDSFTATAYPYYIGGQPSFPIGGVNTDGRPIALDRMFPIPLVADPTMMLSAMPTYNPCTTSGMMMRDPYQPVFMTAYTAPQSHPHAPWANKSYTAL